MFISAFKSSINIWFSKIGLTFKASLKWSFKYFQNLSCQGLYLKNILHYRIEIYKVYKVYLLIYMNIGTQLWKIFLIDNQN